MDVLTKSREMYRRSLPSEVFHTNSYCGLREIASVAGRRLMSPLKLHPQALRAGQHFPNFHARFSRHFRDISRNRSSGVYALKVIDAAKKILNLARKKTKSCYCPPWPRSSLTRSPGSSVIYSIEKKEKRVLIGLDLLF